MRKNILIVIASLGGGGAERVAAQLSNYFNSKNNNVKICFWNDSKNKYDIDNGVSVCKLDSKFRAYALAKEIKSFGPDVILSFTDVSNVISYFAKLLSRSKAKYIPSIHSDLNVRDKHIGLTVKTKFLRVLHKYACNHSDKVVVVSEGARSSFVNYYNVHNHKCICIYNPIYSRVELKASLLENKNERLKIVAVGRLTQAKNYPLLLEVAEELKENGFEFFIDVYGEGELREEIENNISNKNLSAHIKLKGFSKNLSSRLSEYDLFIMTSSWEGFGNVLVEALANSLPIISTDCPSGPREVLDNGRFGILVPVGDSSAIVKSIVSKDYKKEIDIRELKAHLNLFTVKRVGDKYLSLFNELCG